MKTGESRLLYLKASVGVTNCKLEALALVFCKDSFLFSVSFVSWQPIMRFINDQYEAYLQEEININRKKRIPDSRVHCCIYFIPPTGHWWDHTHYVVPHILFLVPTDFPTATETNQAFRESPLTHCPSTALYPRPPPAFLLHLSLFNDHTGVSLKGSDFTKKLDSPGVIVEGGWEIGKHLPVHRGVLILSGRNCYSFGDILHRPVYYIWYRQLFILGYTY